MNCASVASLVLLAAISAMAARSYWRLDQLGWRPGGRSYWIFAKRGTIELYTAVGGPGGDSPVGLAYDSYEIELVDQLSPNDAPPDYSSWDAVSEGKLMGFRAFRGTDQSQGIPSPPLRVWAFEVPYWFLAVCAAALPAVTATRSRRARRRRGLCPACGYDLRASAANCPECDSPQGGVLNLGQWTYST